MAINYEQLIRGLESELEFDTAPPREFPATPVIQLTNVGISGRSTPFTVAPSGFEAFVCDPFPYPQCVVNVQGRILIEENGIKLPFTAADRRVWQPVAVTTGAYPQDGVRISHAYIGPVAGDGSFTTETWLVIHPGTRRIRLRVTLELGSGKKIATEAIAQSLAADFGVRRRLANRYSAFECFLAFIDAWENRYEPWRTGPCRDAVTRLEFVSATRKMFQPPTPRDGRGPDPKWKTMFDVFLARNAEICPLAEFGSSQARAIWRFENLAIGDSTVDIGHVLTGIEGGRRQKPGSTYPSAVVRDANTEALITWAGDLGSALVRYAVAKVAGQRADLADYLKELAGSSDLLGDIDGINLAGLYDENRSLADNFRAYYQARPFRRFQNFLSFAIDDGNNPLFTLASKSPPAIDKASRAHAAGKIVLYARAWIYKAPPNKWTTAQRSGLHAICDENSREINAVIDYFFSFLENGLMMEP